MKYFVLLEQREGVIKNASLDVWNTVQHFAQASSDIDIYGLIIGAGDVEKMVKVCRGKGRVFVVGDERLRNYIPSAYTGIVTELVVDTGALNVFLANTAMGRDLAPRIAMQLHAGLVSDCVVEAGGKGSLSVSTTMYSGAVTAVAKVLSERAVYSLSPRSHRPAMPSGRNVEVKKIVDFSMDHSGWNPVLKKIVYHTGRKDIAEADIIVAGGRGVGGGGNFAMLESLADALGGVVGASRSAVDEGWRPHSEQVGQTGKSVAPKLYIACGISGAVQHIAGMSGAGTVIAINRDAEAPIFKAADYGIVGDIVEVVPQLEKAVRAHSGHH